MELVSKNIAKGEPITDLREFGRLALEKKSVIQKVSGFAIEPYMVRPASFYLGWPLRQLLNSTFYYSIKIK